MKPSEFHPDARFEFQESIRWYNSKESGLGTRFARLAFDAIDRIEQDQSTGILSDFDTRAVLVKPFPYQIIFKDFDETVWIIAVAHMARRPGYWRERIEDIDEDSP